MVAALSGLHFYIIADNGLNVGVPIKVWVNFLVLINNLFNAPDLTCFQPHLDAVRMI